MKQFENIRTSKHEQVEKNISTHVTNQNNLILNLILYFLSKYEDI